MHLQSIDHDLTLHSSTLPASSSLIFRKQSVYSNINWWHMSVSVALVYAKMIHSRRTSGFCQWEKESFHTVIPNAVSIQKTRARRCTHLCSEYSHSSTMWMLMSLFLFFQCSACHQTRNSHRRNGETKLVFLIRSNQISERNRHHRHDLLSPRERGRKREREQRLIINMCELDRRSYRSVETRDWAKLDSIWMHR